MQRPDIYVMQLDNNGLSYQEALSAAQSLSDWQVHALKLEAKLKAETELSDELATGIRNTLGNGCHIVDDQYEINRNELRRALAKHKKARQ